MKNKISAASKNKMMVAKKREIRALYKGGVPVKKLQKKFKLSSGGIRWHLSH